MRVTMYTEQYDPIAVVDVIYDELMTLREFAGDAFELALMSPINAYLNQNDFVARPTYQRTRVMLLVEHVRWADGAERPILVARGLRSIPDGASSVDVAVSLLNEGINCARRRDPANQRRGDQVRLTGMVGMPAPVAIEGVFEQARAAAQAAAMNASAARVTIGGADRGFVTSASYTGARNWTSGVTAVRAEEQIRQNVRMTDAMIRAEVGVRAAEPATPGGNYEPPAAAPTIRRVRR